MESYNSYTHNYYDNSHNPFNPSTEYYIQEEQNIHTEHPQPHPRFRSSFPVRYKNPMKKQPIAPLPPTPPKVYKVDAVDFRDVVQKLTGKEFQVTRLQEVAPPPLSLMTQPTPMPLVHYMDESSGSTTGVEEEKQMKSVESTFGGLSPLGFLSPASVAWCSSILMSPGTVSALEPSALLY